MSQSDGDVFFALGFGAILGGIVGILIAASVLKTDIKFIKKQALDRGYAEFKNDKDGNAVFTWREPNAKQD